MPYGRFDVCLDICDDCSYEDFIREMRGVADARLVEEFGKLYHNPNLYGHPTSKDAPEDYPRRKAQVYAETNKEVRQKYLKRVIPIGHQDPYPFQLCRECLQKYLDKFDEGEK